MALTDTQVYIAFVVALIPGILAFRLATELYKQKICNLFISENSLVMGQFLNLSRQKEPKQQTITFEWDKVLYVNSVSLSGQFSMGIRIGC